MEELFQRYLPQYSDTSNPGFDYGLWLPAIISDSISAEIPIISNNHFVQDSENTDGTPSDNHDSETEERKSETKTEKIEKKCKKRKQIKRCIVEKSKFKSFVKHEVLNNTGLLILHGSTFAIKDNFTKKEIANFYTRFYSGSELPSFDNYHMGVLVIDCIYTRAMDHLRRTFRLVSRYMYEHDFDV